MIFLRTYGHSRMASSRALAPRVYFRFHLDSAGKSKKRLKALWRCVTIKSWVNSGNEGPFLSYLLISCGEGSIRVSTFPIVAFFFVFLLFHWADSNQIIRLLTIFFWSSDSLFFCSSGRTKPKRRSYIPC